MISEKVICHFDGIPPSFDVLVLFAGPRLLYNRCEGKNKKSGTGAIGDMNKEDLDRYLGTRRLGWPYEDSYHVENMGDHRFIARINDELAGLSYAEISDDGKEAVMKMNLKSKYSEYGIGTELLELLMEDLQRSGFDTIRYKIPPERYAFQIYRNLGFTVESLDEDEVRFVWRKSQ